MHQLVLDFRTPQPQKGTILQIQNQLLRPTLSSERSGEEKCKQFYLCFTAFIVIFLKSCSFSFIWSVMQWLYAHPTFLGNQLYIGGDSYSGLIVPILLQNILEGKSLNSEILAPIMHTPNWQLLIDMKTILDRALIKRPHSTQCMNNSILIWRK